MDTDGSNETVVKMNSTTENKDAEQVKPSESSRKNSKGDKLRKKDDKSVEQVLKALNSLETTEEKLAAMCKKYTDIVDENRKLQLAAKQCEKKCCILQREKEQLQTEHSKAVLSRSRLESLCRELQRQNKAIKEESLLKVREEEEKRKEVSAKFQGTLNEITALMQQNIEKNAKLKEENVEMAQRFGKLLEQYEIREQQVEKLLEQIHIETELGEAKMAKARMEMANEREVMLREKKQLLMDLDECRGKIRVLQEGEIGLRGQIRLYTDKYDEFQTALTRSSEVFNGFKGEMEKMSKKICKLEKETTSWKQRWERSHQALLEMAADKQQRDGELALANRRLTQMQALCRTLQAERSALLAQIRGKSEDSKDAEKEEDESNTINDAADSTTGAMEAKESDVIGESGEIEPKVEVANAVIKGNGDLSDAFDIDEATAGSPLLDEKQEIKESLSLVVSPPLDENLSKDLPVELVACVTEVMSHSNTVREVNESEIYVEDNLTNEPEKENIAFLTTDSDISHVPSIDKSNEGSNVSEGSTFQSCKEESLTSELPLVNSSNCEEISEDVRNADIGLNNDKIIMVMDLIKQRLDSCSLNENECLEDEVISKEKTYEPSADGQTVCNENQPEIISDSSVSNQEVENDKEGEGLSQEKPEVEKEPENGCNASTENKMEQEKQQSENVCLRSVQSEDVNNHPEGIGELNGDRLPEEGKDASSNISACLEFLDKCDGKQTEISADKCNAEADKEVKEKPMEKGCTNNCSSKKSDSTPINMKKGKESSRKRKR